MTFDVEHTYDGTVKFVVIMIFTQQWKLRNEIINLFYAGIFWMKNKKNKFCNIFAK